MREIRALAVIAAFFAFIALPLALQLPGRPAADGGWENRVLAPVPAFPEHLDDLALFARGAGAWADDHFGMRRRLVELNNRLRFRLFHESSNPQIAFNQDGELFFTSHTREAPLALLEFLCRAGSVTPAVQGMAAGLAAFMDDAARRNARSLYLLVPTKTAVLADRLPDRMRARCAGGIPAAPATLAELRATRPDVADRVVYPLATLQALGGASPAYPHVNFHWNGGAAPRVVAAQIAGRFGRPSIAPMPTRGERRDSDIQNLLPGVRLRYEATEPDLPAAKILGCDCLPALGPTATVLADVSRFVRSDARGPRLLLLSDSFGKGIAPWFSEYYGEVWHMALSNFDRLSARQLADLKREMFEDYRPDDVLFVFHDFSVAYVNDLMHRSFWPER